jgi:MbtH protein
MSDADDAIYDVVVNDEEQYSIWVQGRQLPAGWQTVGKSGVKTDCLAYIDEVWTDMRPRSLRLEMDGVGQ